jgi:hypothetical protein
MAPFEIRDSLLSDLRKLRNSFAKPTTAAALDRMDDNEKSKVGNTLVNVNIAIRKLENVELQKIADDLNAFEDDLIKASDSLRKAVANLAQFKKAIDAAADVLALLARVGKLVGAPLPIS